MKIEKNKALTTIHTPVAEMTVTNRRRGGCAGLEIKTREGKIHTSLLAPEVRELIKALETANANPFKLKN